MLTLLVNLVNTCVDQKSTEKKLGFGIGFWLCVCYSRSCEKKAPPVPTRVRNLRRPGCALTSKALPWRGGRGPRSSFATLTFTLSGRPSTSCARVTTTDVSYYVLASL